MKLTKIAPIAALLACALFVSACMNTRGTTPPVSNTEVQETGEDMGAEAQ